MVDLLREKYDIPEEIPKMSKLDEIAIRKIIRESLFDAEEFKDAENVFKKELEMDPKNGEFQELGSKENPEGFISDLERTNLELPSDEEKIEKLKKDIDISKRLGKGSYN